MLFKKYCRVSACFGLKARYCPWRSRKCITGALSLQRLPELLADAGCKEPRDRGKPPPMCRTGIYVMAERPGPEQLMLLAERPASRPTHAVEAYIAGFYNTRETPACPAGRGHYCMNRHPRTLAGKEDVRIVRR